MKYAVHYPRSGIHECPFGREQAILICTLATGNGVDAKVATSDDGKVWVW